MTALTEHNEPTPAAIAPLSAATTMSTEITVAERLESVKAGLTGALAAGLVSGALVLVNSWLSLHVTQLAALPTTPDNVRMLIGGLIALLSGFLFGMTYRYIIRQDQNPHLKSGAVLAFGLVRGLAQVEGKLDEPIALLPSVMLGAESLLLFTGARFVLDTALWEGWVKPFGALTATANDAVEKPSTSSAYSVKSSNSG